MGRLQPVYLAVSGKLFGMFVVGYQGSREIAASLHTLQKSGLSLLVRTDDFSLTGDLIEQAYRLRPGSVKVLTENETNQLATATGYLPESEGCMVHLGSLASYVGGLHAAACAVSAEKSANLVMAVSVAVSALVALVLSFSGGLASLALPGGGAVSAGLGGAGSGAAAHPQLLTVCKNKCTAPERRAPSGPRFRCFFAVAGPGRVLLGDNSQKRKERFGMLAD